MNHTNHLPIRILSDLHNEFHTYEIEPTLADNQTVLVLAGDIDTIKNADRIKSFFTKCSDMFKAVIWVMGNHEHWKSSYELTFVKAKELTAEMHNVHVLENEFVEIDNVVFIGATMWTTFNNRDPLKMYTAERRMTDYRKIRRENYKAKLTSTFIANKNEESTNFIFSTAKQMKASGKRVVVVTHHGPSLQSIHERFKQDTLNDSYCSDLEPQIIEAGYELHIHGHVHNSFDYYVDNTRIITNPRGYYGYELNSEFDPTLTVHV